MIFFVIHIYKWYKRNKNSCFFIFFDYLNLYLNCQASNSKTALYNLWIIHFLCWFQRDKSSPHHRLTVWMSSHKILISLDSSIVQDVRAVHGEVIGHVCRHWSQGADNTLGLGKKPCTPYPTIHEHFKIVLNSQKSRIKESEIFIQYTCFNNEEFNIFWTWQYIWFSFLFFRNYSSHHRCQYDMLKTLNFTRRFLISWKMSR